MNSMPLTRTAGWVSGLGAAAGLQLWWWSGGPAWLPILTGPALVAATLGINQETRRRSDPVAAAKAALRSGGLVSARQG